MAFVINSIGAALLAIGDLQLTMPQCDALGVTGTAVTVCTTVLIRCVMCFDRILQVAKPHQYTVWMACQRTQRWTLLILVGCFWFI